MEKNEAISMKLEDKLEAKRGRLIVKSSRKIVGLDCVLGPMVFLRRSSPGKGNLKGSSAIRASRSRKTGTATKIGEEQTEGGMVAVFQNLIDTPRELHRGKGFSRSLGRPSGLGRVPISPKGLEGGARSRRYGVLGFKQSEGNDIKKGGLLFGYQRGLVRNLSQLMLQLPKKMGGRGYDKVNLGTAVGNTGGGEEKVWLTIGVQD